MASTGKEVILLKNEIEKNFFMLIDFLVQKNCTSLYLPGGDEYLSEYVSKFDSLKYYFSGFTGSTSEVFINVETKNLYLFVDGRYHLQADLECSEFSFIKVVKLSIEVSPLSALLNQLKKDNITDIGIVIDRTSLFYSEKIDAIVKNRQNFLTQEITSLIAYKLTPLNSEVFLIDSKIHIDSMEEKMKKISLKEKEGVYLSSPEDAAWLANCRSYVIPYTSFFLAKSLLTKNRLYVYLPSEMKISPDVKKLSQVTFLFGKLENWQNELSKIQKQENLEKIFYDPMTVTLQDKLVMDVVFAGANIEIKAGMVSTVKSIKTANELIEYDRINILSSQAIAETIRWTKKMVVEGKSISEKAISNKIQEEYKRRGSVDLSFKTIAARKENSAVIHYGNSSEENLIDMKDVVLLDSGAYYESGLATDATRTFVVSPSHLNQSELEILRFRYTLVLKAQMRAEMSLFKSGLMANSIDHLARTVFSHYGLDFAHGLGHGVGIRVHDPGGRISPSSREYLQEGIVFSIEPGLYVEGEYGIRLENVVSVLKHSIHDQFCYFRPLIRVGWEEELIDFKMLDPLEIEYFNQYQSECAKLGTLTHL